MSSPASYYLGGIFFSFMPLFAFGVSRVVWVESGKTPGKGKEQKGKGYRLFLKVEGEEGLAQSDTSCHPRVAFVMYCRCVFGCAPFLWVRSFLFSFFFCGETNKQIRPASRMKFQFG